MAGLARGEVDARELVTVDREAADLLVAESQPDRHVVEAAAQEDRAARVLEFIALNESERDQALEGVVQVGHLLADQLELVGRLVVRQDVAAAIENHAAAGWNRIEPHAIAL